MPLHILIGENDARETWDDCVRRRRTVSWIVPKGARPQDEALFVFNRDRFVGSGVIDSETEPDEFLGRPAFRADVRNLRQFKIPLRVDDVAKRVPEWKWPRSYTKGRTTPAEPISRQLHRLIDEHVARVGIVRPGSDAAPSVREPENAPPERWADVVPESLRAPAARALARSIRGAHALHPACWTVTLGRRFVRLNVGVPLALTLKSDGCELIVMANAPELRELRRLGVKTQGGFRKAPGTVCVTFPLSSLEAAHRSLWNTHSAALRVAVGKQGATPHSGYSHELIRYLRSLKRQVPDSECAGALEALRTLGEEVPQAPAFDPHDLPDGREYDRRMILRRQGQPAFRLALLRAYDGMCAVTGCRVVEVLQAAHIIPYRGAATDRVQNGLLLRADIHDLFDLGKLDFDEEWRVRLHEDLRGSPYEEFEGRPAGLPRDETLRPSLRALRLRREATLTLRAAAPGSAHREVAVGGSSS